MLLNLLLLKQNEDFSFKNIFLPTLKIFEKDWDADNLKLLSRSLMDFDFGQKDLFTDCLIKMHLIALDKLSQSESKSLCKIKSSNFIKMVKKAYEINLKLCEETNSKIERIENGLKVFKSATEQVKESQEYLETYKPQLSKYSSEVKETLSLISSETEAISKLVEDSSAVKEKFKEQYILAESLEKSCSEELQKVMPLYQEALSALDTVKASDLAIIKNLPHPPVPIIKVMEAICILKGIPMAPGDSDYWPASRRILNDIGFLNSLKDFDKDSLNEETIENIRNNYLNLKDFNPEKISNVSQAAEGICKWVIAIEKYYNVNK